METFGKTVTHESVSFRNTKDRWSCFGNWFNTKDQEIGNYYNEDGVLTLENVANFLIEHKDMTCNAGCKVPMLAQGETTYEVEVARFWDGDGGTDDVEVLGQVTIKRTGNICLAKFDTSRAGQRQQRTALAERECRTVHSTISKN